MKIGMLTIFRNNYGAILQAYALQTTLKSLDHIAEVIDYNYAPPRKENLFTSWNRAKRIIINISNLLRHNFLVKRKRRIKKFYNQNLTISERKYFSSHDLINSLSEYGAFICGSDQVWNVNSNHDRSRAFFLAFAKQHQTLKISYAPSFGVSSISRPRQQEIQPWINDIPYLSVREETGRVIIQKVTGRKAEVVLDPTLLLDSGDWNRLAAPSMIKGPYILVYSTSQRGLFSELVKHIKRTTALPIIVLSLTSLNLIPQADRVIFDAGPSEFISLFANAACVCTNSFHGIAFSIIYRKPFWSVPHKAANSRIADLLGRIGLSNRQVKTLDQFPKLPLEINYKIPASLLAREKAKSIDFLKAALQ